MTLGDLARNQKAIIKELPNDVNIATQLLEQGFVPSAEISLAHKAPWNGPMAFRVDNTKVTLGQRIAKLIEVDFIL